MPAPYRTLAEILEDAEAQHTPPLEYILDLAHDYAWDEPQTVAVLEAYARHNRHQATRPAPQPLADILAQANQFAAELDDENDDPTRLPALEHAVTNYTSAAWTAAQTDDPAALEALEHWTGAIAEVIGLDPIPTSPTDTIRASLEAAVRVNHLTDDEAATVLDILERAGY